WDVVPGLRLNDSLKNHTDFAEQALSTATFVLAMSRPAYDRLPRDLKTAIDNNSGQAAASMAGAMWDLEAKAVAGAARDRGEPVVVISGEEAAPWRKATEPVIAAWQKQMKGGKLDGDKLLADVRSLLTKYAEEPEPEQPQPARPEEQPVEQQAIGEPQQLQTVQPKSQGFTRPRADAPAVEAAAPPPSPAPPPSRRPHPQCSPPRRNHPHLRQRQHRRLLPGPRQRLSPRPSRKSWISRFKCRMSGDRTNGSSWPDLFRPSTSLLSAGKQDVDARDKREHDDSI